MFMSLIIRPIVTEKAAQHTESMNRYSFVVSKSANKIDIKKAIEDSYSVKVKSVRTMNYYGKMKSRFTKGGVIVGSKNSFKKAIIDLAEGDSIDFYSNV